MPDAQYTFLPWLRRGVVGLAGGDLSSRPIGSRSRSNSSER